MADVKWIKFMVGTFDGSSFKRIKKARLKDGTSYRDRLTAIWFELLDLAGNKNLNGKLVDEKELELPYDAESQFEDIATMIDRPVEEVECAIVWFLKNRMIEIIDNVYCLSNWSKYQSVASLDDVREKTRLRTIEYRKRLKEKKECDVTSDVSVTSSDASRIKNKNKEEELDKELDIDKNRYIVPSDNDIQANADVENIFNLWNECKITIHKHITEDMIKAINKALSIYGTEQIGQAIKHYYIVFKDNNYYFNYKWKLVDFLNQSNALPTFLDEGDKWVNYTNSKQGKKTKEKELLGNKEFQEEILNDFCRTR